MAKMATLAHKHIEVFLSCSEVSFALHDFCYFSFGCIFHGYLHKAGRKKNIGPHHFGQGGPKIAYFGLFLA